MSSDEHIQAIYPIVGESVAHNARTLSNIRNLSSPVLGLAAGALSLESTTGFIFFLIGTLLTSLLIYIGPAAGRPEQYFGAAGAGARRQQGNASGLSLGLALEVALGGLGIEAVMGFVMSWTLAFNLVAT